MYEQFSISIPIDSRRNLSSTFVPQKLYLRPAHVCVVVNVIDVIIVGGVSPAFIRLTNMKISEVRREQIIQHSNKRLRQLNFYIRASTVCVGWTTHYRHKSEGAGVSWPVPILFRVISTHRQQQKWIMLHFFLRICFLYMSVIRDLVNFHINIHKNCRAVANNILNSFISKYKFDLIYASFKQLSYFNITSYLFATSAVSPRDIQLRV